MREILSRETKEHEQKGGRFWGKSGRKELKASQERLKGIDGKDYRGLLDLIGMGLEDVLGIEPPKIRA